MSQKLCVMRSHVHAKATFRFQGPKIPVRISIFRVNKMKETQFCRSTPVWEDFCSYQSVDSTPRVRRASTDLEIWKRFNNKKHSESDLWPAHPRPPTSTPSLPRLTTGVMVSAAHVTQNHVTQRRTSNVAMLRPTRRSQVAFPK